MVSAFFLLSPSDKGGGGRGGQRAGPKGEGGWAAVRHDSSRQRPFCVEGFFKPLQDSGRSCAEYCTLPLSCCVGRSAPWTEIAQVPQRESQGGPGRISVTGRGRVGHSRRLHPCILLPCLGLAFQLASMQLHCRLGFASYLPPQRCFSLRWPFRAPMRSNARASRACRSSGSDSGVRSFVSARAFAVAVPPPDVATSGNARPLRRYGRGRC